VLFYYTTRDLPAVQHLTPPSHITSILLTTGRTGAPTAEATSDVDLLIGSDKSDDPILQPDWTPSTTGPRITGWVASASAVQQQELAVQLAGYLQRNAENFFGALVAD
jgi:hypothetical protein